MTIFKKGFKDNTFGNKAAYRWVYRLDMHSIERRREHASKPFCREVIRIDRSKTWLTGDLYKNFYGTDNQRYWEWYYYNLSKKGLF